MTVDGPKQPPDALAVLAALRELRTTDLSHPLHPAMPVFPGRNVEPFERRPTAHLAEHGVNAARLGIGEHQGTHLDAPIHFVAGGETVDQVPVHALVSEAVVIDVTEEARHDPGHRLTVPQLEAWETRNGPFPRGAFALVRTGWGRRWADPRAYVGSDDEGRPRHPACAPDAARWLVDRGAAGVGVDTLSVDNGTVDGVRSPSHKVIHGAGRYVLENLARLEELPNRGILLVIGALPVVAGTGGPARVIAFHR